MQALKYKRQAVTDITNTYWWVCEISWRILLGMLWDYMLLMLCSVWRHLQKAYVSASRTAALSTSSLQLGASHLLLEDCWWRRLDILKPRTRASAAENVESLKHRTHSHLCFFSLMKSDVCYYHKHTCSCRVAVLTEGLKEPHIWPCLCVYRALIWRGRSAPWPMPSALPGIRKTPCGMFSTSPHWRLCPAFRIGLRSNAPVHAEALSGFLSSLPGLRFTSTHPPSERTAPKAACSCRTRDPVCAQMSHTAHGLILLLNSCLIVFALKKKDNTIITRTNIISQNFFFFEGYLSSELSSLISLVFMFS